MKKTFLTLISSDEYLEGVLVLNESLKRTTTEHKLTVLVTRDVSVEVENKIQSFDINTIRRNDSIDLPHEGKLKNITTGRTYWNKTLDKLYIFELTEFDKIVYLDSDMIVLENIDELFDKPHMSAVIDMKLHLNDSDEVIFNSGTLVIEPKKGLLDEFIKLIPCIIDKKEYLGDQDILNEYYHNWSENKDLELDLKYNLFHWDIPHYIIHYTDRLSPKKGISIVHYTGSIKPWMLPLNRYKNYTKDSSKSDRILRYYMKILDHIRNTN